MNTNNIKLLRYFKQNLLYLLVLAAIVSVFVCFTFADFRTMKIKDLERKQEIKIETEKLLY